MVDRLKNEYAGKVEFTVYVDETDAAGDQIAQQLGVRYVPTLVFVNTDGSVAKTDVGAISEEAFRSRLDALK